MTHKFLVPSSDVFPSSEDATPSSESLLLMMSPPSKFRMTTEWIGASKILIHCYTSQFLMVDNIQ